MKVIRVYLVVVGALLGFFVMLFLNDSKPGDNVPVAAIGDLPPQLPEPRRNEHSTEIVRSLQLVRAGQEEKQPKPPKVTAYSVTTSQPVWPSRLETEEEQGQEKAVKKQGESEIKKEARAQKNEKEQALERADKALQQGKIAEAVAAFNEAVKLDPADARSYVRRALAHVLQGASDLAIADCSKALELQPHVALYWEDRALLYFGKQRYAEAIADLSQAIERDPTNGMLYTDRALAYWAVGNKVKAQADFTQAEKFERTPEYNPLTWQGGLPPVPATRTLEEWNEQVQVNAKDDQAYFGRGMVNFLLRCKLADAYEDFCKAIDINPKVANYYHARGRILLLWQNQFEAIRDFDQAIKLGLNTSQVHNIRGAALKGIGKDEEANAAFSLARKAQSQVPADARVAARPKIASESITGKPVLQPGVSTGTANAKASQWPSLPAWLPKETSQPTPNGSMPPGVQGVPGGPYFPAPNLGAGSQQKPSTEALVLDRQRENARLMLNEASSCKSQGRAFLLNKRYADAIKSFTQSIDLDPNDGEACDQRGQAYLYLADYENAQKDFATAIWLDPKKAAYHAHRGIALYYGQNLRESLSAFEAANAIDPGDPAHINYMGMARLALNDAAGADREFSKALALNQRDARALNNRASALRMQNRLKEALADYTKAIEIDPRVAAFLVNRGNAYCIQDQHDSAIADFCRAIEMDPSIAEAYAGRAISYSALRMDKAAEQDRAQVARMKLPRYR